MPSLTATLTDPARLAALYATLLLDSAPEPEFDRLTRLAKRLLDVPTALISLVDGERQFFKSCVGLTGWPAEERGTPISYSFCKHVVHSGEPLAIADARDEPLVRDNPAVAELDVVAYLGVPLHARDGHILGTICAVDSEVRDWSPEDIAAMRDLAEGVMTEIALAEQVRTVTEAAEAKARLLANMSHELRTPLNGILGILDLLRDSRLADHQRDLLRTASSSGGELLRIVNDVLDLSKLEAGKLQLDPHTFSLSDAVEDTCHLLAPGAHAKGVALVAWVDPSLPAALYGDGGRLRQVLTNLISNAVKFTDVGDVVVRAASDGPERVRFSVADSGIGIAPDRLPELFKPYEQADLSTTRHHGGTGLGLTITRELVELMGGRLDAESELGRGTTFAFSVPLSAADHAPLLALPGKPRVHVAVTHATTRAVIADYLTAHGAACEPADACDLVIADASAIVDAAAPRLLVKPAAEAGPGALPTPVRRGQLVEFVTRLLSPPTCVAGKVLVADDHNVNRLVIQLMLTKRGIDVDTVTNGEEAVDAVATGEYAAVFMDCEMPVADGFTATARIRAGGHELPIIALTGHVAAEDRARCLQSGMDDHLAKPIDSVALDALLERWGLVSDAAPNGTSAS